MRIRFAAIILLAITSSVVCNRRADAVTTLVGDPFVSGYNNWVDTFSGTPQANAPPNWRLHFGNESLMESADGRAADGVTNAGDYTPYLLIQDALTTPSTYTINSRFFTSDDDGFGLAFGWQDNDNYFRVSMREQSNGNLGFTRGLSVQKVVGGVITQISPLGVGEGNLLVPTQPMIDNHTPIDLILDVNGNDWSVSAAGINGGAPLASGTDAELMAGKFGILSWAQFSDSGDGGIHPGWGTEVAEVSVQNAAGGTLFSDTFPTVSVSPIAWRNLVMTNSDGVATNATGEGKDLGNFGLQFTNRSISDNSNGYEWATATAPNTDFIGPAIVVDEPGSENFADYEMRVRMTNDDDDGIGALVRVQDDNNFYRFNFAEQGIGLNEQRAPAGLSVQKVENGVWSELFRDDQNNPLFLFDHITPTPFDVKIRAIGNQLAITVIEDPDGAANVINYPLITDTSNPLLTGTVGFANWGSGGGNLGNLWSAFGGASGPLVTLIPEPTSALLLLAGAGGLFGSLRRRR